MLEPGEVVACSPAVAAPTGSTTSTMLAPELNEYPGSGKLWARNYPPGGEPGEDAVELIARPEDGLASPTRVSAAYRAAQGLA